MNIFTDLLSEGERFDSRHFVESRQLLCKKVHTLYFFFTADKSVQFFIDIKWDSESPIGFSCNWDFRLINTKSLKSKLTLTLIDPLSTVDFWNELYHNAFVYTCTKSGIELSKCGSMEIYTGDSNICVRDPLKEEYMRWKCKFISRSGIIKKIEKQGKGDEFIKI